MRIVPIPCLTDNYAYLVMCPATRAAAVVDPSEAEPVLEEIERVKSEARAGAVDVKAVLCTHHHYDHVGGNERMRAALPGVVIVGSEHDRDRIPEITETVRDGDTLSLGQLSIRVLEVPGHTLGAVAYVIESPDGDAAVFTGDTLFVGGSGRLFEGTPDMMHASLSRLAALDGATKVYCGHEYTEQNLRFARVVDGENPHVRAAVEEARERRAAGEPTVPSTIERELRTNPFMRTRASAVRASVGAGEGVSDGEVLGRLRERKNEFR